MVTLGKLTPISLLFSPCSSCCGPQLLQYWLIDIGAGSQVATACDNASCRDHNCPSAFMFCSVGFSHHSQGVLFLFRRRFLEGQLDPDRDTLG